MSAAGVQRDAADGLRACLAWKPSSGRTRLAGVGCTAGPERPAATPSLRESSQVQLVSTDITGDARRDWRRTVLGDR